MIKSTFHSFFLFLPSLADNRRHACIKPPPGASLPPRGVVVWGSRVVFTLRRKATKGFSLPEKKGLACLECDRQKFHPITLQHFIFFFEWPSPLQMFSMCSLPDGYMK